MEVEAMEESCLTSLISMASLVYFVKYTQDHLHMDGGTHSELDPPPSISNKKKKVYHRLAHMASLERAFS